MGLAFFSGFNRRDALVGAMEVWSVYTNNKSMLAEIWANIEKPTEALLVDVSSAVPTVGVIVSQNYVVLAIEGTTNLLQMILEALASAQGTWAGVPGTVNLFMAAAATDIKNVVLPLISPFLSGRRLVLLGHSLGGAIAQILVALLGPTDQGAPTCWVFGSPRVGDPVFCNAITGNVYRLAAQNAEYLFDDPIPSIPPTLWASEGFFPWKSGPPPLQTYGEAGLGNAIDEGGNIFQRGVRIVFPTSALAVQDSRNLQVHALSTYIGRLNLQFTPDQYTPPIPGYVTPELIPDDFDFFFPPESGEQGMGIVKTTLFYNIGEGGISESFWSLDTPSQIRSTWVPQYLTARMGIATSDFKFIYARISPVDNPRQVDFVVDTDAGITSQGIWSSTVYETCEDNDALLLRLKLVAGPSARIFLHGFPQTVASRQEFFPDNIPGFKANYFSFIANLVSNGTHYTYEISQNVPIESRIDITGITPHSPRGAVITPAAGPSLPTAGATVYIGGAGAGMYGIRGRKRVITGGTVTTFIVGGAQPVGTYAGVGAYYYPVVFDYLAVDYGGVERATTHKCGRPFGSPVGRRSNQLALRR